MGGLWLALRWTLVSLGEMDTGDPSPGLAGKVGGGPAVSARLWQASQSAQALPCSGGDASLLCAPCSEP